MESTFLISDDRERNVIGFLQAAFAGSGFGFEARRITTGDYLIFRRLESGEVRLLAVIERKTLKDFAASLVDGRHGNREKMLRARDEKKAQVFYLIEGPAFPAPTRKFGRVPYRSIQTAITNLSVRDQIHIVRARDAQDTADKLLGLVRAFARLDEVLLPELPADSGASEGAEPEFLGAGEADQVGEAGQSGEAGDGIAVPRELTAPVKKSDHRLATEMWSKLPGVSVVTAGALAGCASVAGVLSGECSVAEIKTPTGRALNARARRSLERLAAGERKESLLILSGVPGISKKVAAELLDAVALSGMVAPDGADRLAEVTLQQSSRRVRLGPKRAGAVVRLLSWRLTRD